MKKILLTLAAVVLSFGMLSAQDMSQATETAKMANESLVAGNKALALTCAVRIPGGARAGRRLR